MIDDSELSPFLRRYFESWRTFSIPSLLDLWSPRATYSVLGKHRLVGIEEIAQYWRENAATQRGVRWSVERQLLAGADIVAVWAADFDRVDLGRHYSLNGVLWMETEANTIVTFVEAYTRRDE